jgi:ammonia channel protein AmtB
MVGKNVISTMLQSFMAMIIVTILWVVIIFYHLAHLLAALSVILYLIYSCVGPNTAWSLAQPYRFYYSLYSKLNSHNYACVDYGALLNEFVLGLYAIHGSFFY